LLDRLAMLDAVSAPRLVGAIAPVTLVLCVVAIVDAQGPAAPPRVADSPNACLSDTGSRSWCGDGGEADRAKLAAPADISVAGRDGSVLIADSDNNVIRRMRPDGTIVTIAGTGERGTSLDPRRAENVGFDGPLGVAATADGDVLVADTGNDAIRAISTDGSVTTLVGATGAIRESLRAPADVVALADGGMLIADTGDNRVLRVSAAGDVDVVAGVGTAGRGGDGGPASAARLSHPTQVFPAGDGGALIADTGNGAIRRVTAAGVIETITRGLTDPRGVAELADGTVIAASSAGVFRVGVDGTRRRIAGEPHRGFNGEGGDALATRFDGVGQLAFAVDGRILLTDSRNDRVRALDAAGGVRTIAGSGEPKHLATLDQPPPAPPAELIAPATSSRRSPTQPASAARSQRCARYNGKFATFGLMPFPVNPLRGKAGRSLTLRYQTSRRADVAAELYRGARRVALKIRRHVGSSRQPHRIRVKRHLKKHRYVVWLWGRSLATGILRCDSRRLRVR
jgi:hypothetical protein